MTTASVDAGFAPPAYAPSLRWLHWGVAALIFLAIAFGVTAIYTPRGPVRAELLALHKSIGVTVLALVVVRVLFRLALPTPNYVPPLSAFNLYASKLGHLGLYALMIALPISGYVHSSAGDHSFAWFGLFPVPQWVAPDKNLDELAGGAHYLLAWAIGVLLVGHIGAAIWHAAVKKDGVLARMWPRRSALTT
jgi:cytochrome b561